MISESTARRLDDETDLLAFIAERLRAVVSHQPDRTVVALTGEHDISNEDSLAAILAQAMSLRDANVVVDLRRVEFMSASTIHVIERAREELAMQSRLLTLRSPSPVARRLLDLCHTDYSTPPDLIRNAPQGANGSAMHPNAAELLSVCGDGAGRLEYGAESGPFQNEPYRDHWAYGRVTVMGRTVNTVDEWTVKDADGTCWTIGEFELAACPPVP